MKEEDMTLNPLAQELNKEIRNCNESVYQMLSEFGKRVFFPKGIVSQSGEAKKQATRFNATIGIATENGKAMMLECFNDLISPNIESHKILPYAPSDGVLGLRQSWQAHQQRQNPGMRKATLPVVCSGLTHGLSLVGDLFLDEGGSDTVILPKLFWGNYKLIWQIKKTANIVSYELFDKGLNHFNFNDFAEAITKYSSNKKKTMLLFNFPQNPTGYSLKKHEAKQIEDFLLEQAKQGKKFITVCDDAYWGLTYENDCQKESLFSNLSQLHENILAIKIDGCTKEFFMWGMRVGFLTYGFKGMTAPCSYALERKTAAAIRGNISNATHHSQEVLSKMLVQSDIESQKASKEEILRKRYAKTKEIVYAEEYKNLWEAYPFNSGYFMCLRIKNSVDAEQLRVHLLNEYQTGIVSLSKQDIRIAFSCLAEKDIPEFFNCLASAINDLRN